MTRAALILNFLDQLDISEFRLPAGITLLNPYGESAFIRETSRLFYEKFYQDVEPRTLILGINPGRFGAGMTGLPLPIRSV